MTDEELKMEISLKELATYRQELNAVGELLFYQIRSVDLIIYYKDSTGTTCSINLNHLHYFPFDLVADSKVLVRDAVDSYTQAIHDIINATNNNSNEQK